MIAIRVTPVITTADRLGLTVFFAIIAHAILILGVTFTSEIHNLAKLDIMEIILVHKADDKPPEKADYLAQANQQGGGESERLERPGAPLSSPFPDQVADMAATAQTDSGSPPPEPVKPENILTTELDVAPPAPSDKPYQPSRPAIVKNSEPRPSQAQKNISAAALISRSLAIATLDAEIKQALYNRTKRPRKTFISANTREVNYANYMEAWRAKVERVGNLNYPNEARRRRLSGSLILEVALNADGSIHDISVRRPSGHKILDDAAVRIVKLASPYARFPKAIQKQTDILYITRTWQFLSSNRLMSH